MTTAGIAVLTFVAAYAFFRQVLGGKNWSEGVAFALVIALLAAIVASAI